MVSLTMNRAHPESFIRSVSAFTDLDGVRFPAATKTHRALSFRESPDGASLDVWVPYWLSDLKGRPIAGFREKAGKITADESTSVCHLHFPPWTGESQKNEVLVWLSKRADVFYGLTPAQGSILIESGYELEHQRVAMVLRDEGHSLQPSESTKAIEGCSEATKSHMTKRMPGLDELSELHVRGFKGGMDALWYEKCFGKQPEISIYREELSEWYERCCRSEGIPWESSVHYRDDHGELIGACLIGEEDGLPTVFSLVVAEGHRRSGVAMCMMNESIDGLRSGLKSKCADDKILCQLYVTTGNPAIELYRRLGFVEMMPFGKYIRG